MIRYHGTPMTPTEVAVRVLRGRHAFVSYVAQDSLTVVADCCASFALDNGAFTFWRQNRQPDWAGYYRWVEDIARNPACDWAVIPDVIDGSEEENDALISEWPHGSVGVPVWHLHESIDRLRRLASDWERVCLGSSGHFSTPGSDQWWMRMGQALEAITDHDGFPMVKLHGLRMLNPSIFAHVPMASADSTNVAQNSDGIKWHSPYEPATKATKALVIAERIELAPAARVWAGKRQQELFA